ncbi:MAG: lipoyl(octanoyl) transferase LipB [Gammaproteobacteria bacterium]
MSSFLCRDLGLQPLPAVWADMKRFTDERDAGTRDEVWFVEHPPIYTLGLNADRSHVLAPGEIPLLQIDRGGQVTYHGPGQLVVYPLLDLRRLRISVRGLVQALEAAVIETVAAYGIEAYGRRDAPGVYVEGRKLAAVGLRIRRNCSYHGLAINVDMDLEPFGRINPCGFEDLEVTQLRQLSAISELARVRRDIEPQLKLGLDHFSAAS